GGAPRARPQGRAPPARTETLPLAATATAARHDPTGRTLGRSSQWRWPRHRPRTAAPTTRARGPPPRPAARPPLPPGSVTAAGLAGGSDPVQTAWSWPRWPWSKSPQPSPTPAPPPAPPPVWPGGTFDPGATGAKRDSDEQLVVPWGQVKLLSNGGLKTYDGSQIAFGRVSLGTQGLAEPVVDKQGD